MGEYGKNKGILIEIVEEGLMCNKIIKLIGMFFALALLGACGGGGGDSDSSN